MTSSLTGFTQAGKGLQTFSDTQYKKVADYLDKRPAVYEKVLVVNHLFRASAMYGALIMLPLHPVTSFGAMLGPSLLYRASIERFCVFRFTLPALAGGAALWMAKAAATSLVAGAALSSLGSALAAGLGLCSLAGYLIYIQNVAHEDIARYMGGKQKSCCAGA